MPAGGLKRPACGRKFSVLRATPAPWRLEPTGACFDHKCFVFTFIQ